MGMGVGGLGGEFGGIVGEVGWLLRDAGGGEAGDCFGAGRVVGLAVFAEPVGTCVVD